MIWRSTLLTVETRNSTASIFQRCRAEKSSQGRSAIGAAASAAAGKSGRGAISPTAFIVVLQCRRGAPVSIQFVLYDLAGAHDQIELVAISREQPDILQRIAVDDDQVGMGLGPDAAEPALLHQNLCAHRRGLAQHLERRENF